MSSRDETTQAETLDGGQPKRAEGRLALVLIASAHAPSRCGEVAFLSSGSWLLGRQGTLPWIRHRPGIRQPTGPLDDPRISRKQLAFEVLGRDVTVRSEGKGPLTLNGRPVTTASLRVGDVLVVGKRLALLLTRRPDELGGEAPRRHRFGEGDAQGMVGESPAAWRLRSELAFAGPRSVHVLVLGPSGAGKELIARGLHAVSGRKGALVSRNAATIPPSLADAELFGNLQNYPNPGMAARPGLVGAADRGSLFLDEFGELPLDVQARLLRVLDGGEYTRLGEAKARVADLRLIAATNRDPAQLKHDVLARFPLRIEVPPLNERAEDVPLLAFHLLRGIARDDPEVVRRFFIDGDVRGIPRIDVGFLAELVRHPWSTHVRELSATLWTALARSPGEVLVGDTPVVSRQVAEREVSAPNPATLAPEVVQAALDRNEGRQEPTWRELGLGSRHVLARLVKKHGLKVKGRG